MKRARVRRQFLWLSVVTALIATTAVGTSALAAPGDITLVSTSDAGVKGDGYSSSARISADGTKVAFESVATNLDPADTHPFSDIYVKELATGDITLASTNDAGTKGDEDSAGPSISADGTRVAFATDSTNFDPPNTNIFFDIYVKDLTTGDITRASTNDAGLDSNGYSQSPSLSADGTKVAFSSTATNLDPADTDSFFDIYVKDLTTGDITLVSTNDDGIKGDGDSPSLSGDGTSVAFHSSATNLDPADTDVFVDVYVKDLSTGDITLASTNDAGSKGNSDSFSFSNSALSANGASVAFQSSATNLDPADTDDFADVYVKDLSTGDITLASTNDAGRKRPHDSYVPSISFDGTKVAFTSGAPNLDPDDDDMVPDVYVKDLITGDTTLVSTDDAGTKGNNASFDPRLSADGTSVGFSSSATNLDPADTDSTPDVYVKELGGVPVPSADVSVTKSDSRDPAAAGTRLTYRISIRNHGPEPATGVTLTDELPTGVVFVSARSRQGSCSEVGGIVTCDLGTILNGERAQVRIVVRLTESGILTNTAEVSANEADSNSANNSDTERTTVQ